MRTSERVAASSELQPTAERGALCVERACAPSFVHKVSVVAAERQAEQVVRQARAGSAARRGLAR